MADAFADMLSPQAAPPPPKLGFTGVLSSFFGGDPAGSYVEGLNTGSQYRLRSAQTESAMAEAEKRRAEMMREQLDIDTINKVQAAGGPGIADLFQLGRDPRQYGMDPLSQQEHGFRSILGDTGAAPDAQFAAGQGVQGRMLPRMYEVGGETVNMAADPNATFQTPAQQVDVRAQEALIGQRNRSPATSARGDGGYNAPSGFMWDPANPGQLVPIPGGPKDPNYEGPQGQLGARESAQYQRVITAAALAIPGIKNIMMSPDSASLGVLSGVEGGSGILSNTKGALARQMTSDDAKQFQSMWAGMNRALATIETSGMIPPGALTASFDTLAFLPGDTHEVKLGKLAEMRQTVEYGLGALAMNPRIPPGLRNDIVGLVNQVKEAVPFTREDVIALTAARDPRTTLQDVIRLRGLAGQPGAGPAAPAAGAGKPMPPESELRDAAARRGTTVEALREQLRARGYQ